MFTFSTVESGCLIIKALRHDHVGCLILAETHMLVFMLCTLQLINFNLIRWILSLTLPDLLMTPVANPFLILSFQKSFIFFFLLPGGFKYAFGQQWPQWQKGRRRKD